MESLLIVKQFGTQKKLTNEQEAELFCVISTKTPEEVGLVQYFFDNHILYSSIF